MNNIRDQLNGLKMESDLLKGRATVLASLWQNIPRWGNSPRGEHERWLPYGPVIRSVPEDRIVMNVMQT